MKKEMGLIAIGALVAIVLVGGTNALNLRDDGIQFPDGTVQMTAAGGLPLKTFYLTDLTVPGGAALSACSNSYHMGHIWEFRNLDALRYDGDAPGAFDPTRSPEWDLEVGPPLDDYMNVDQAWIRTGATPIGNENQRQLANCFKWTSSAATAFGKTGRVSAEPTHPLIRFEWSSLPIPCDTLSGVWCVED